MLEHALLYLIPIKGDSGSKPGMTCGGEFLKIQPGTGDNLSPEDIAQGYTDYVIWNRFRAEELDIDGELPVECVDSGMLLLKEGPTSIATAASQPRNDMQGYQARELAHAFDDRSLSSPKGNDIAKDVLEQAYGASNLEAALLLGDYHSLKGMFL